MIWKDTFTGRLNFPGWLFIKYIHLLIFGKSTRWKGRLKFNNHDNSAPFPSALIIFTNDPEITEKDKLINKLKKTETSIKKNLENIADISPETLQEINKYFFWLIQRQQVILVI